MLAPTPGRLRYLVVIVGLLAGLTGCAVEHASSVTPEGLLTVLGPFPGFSPSDLPGDWTLESNGDITEKQLGVITRDGLPALRISNGKAPFIIVRRTKAMVLTTPYLSWSWNIQSPSAPGFHPVRIIVGFHGGNPTGRSWGGQVFKFFGNPLPPHDRALSLTWGESALQRGTMDLSQRETPGAAPRYTVRGGRENADTWWLETVDLADLYAKAWPDDDISHTHITFIGIAAAGGRPPAPAYVSGILLSR